MILVLVLRRWGRAPTPQTPQQEKWYQTSTATNPCLYFGAACVGDPHARRADR